MARTLVDLAAAVNETELARACHEAGVRHHTTPRQVESVLARHPNTKGAATLRAIMRGEVRVTLSQLEQRFLERLRHAGLPLPETNRPAGGRRVDCRWPDYQLTVELDGYRYHHTRHAWENDRRREREAYARDDEFRRYTYGDVVEEPRLMLAELCALLPRLRCGPMAERRSGIVHDDRFLAHRNGGAAAGWLRVEPFERPQRLEWTWPCPTAAATTPIGSRWSVPCCLPCNRTSPS